MSAAYDHDAALRHFKEVGRPLTFKELRALRGRRREPEDRRTESKVRANSRLKGTFEGEWWAPFDRRNVGDYLLTAERFENLHKPKGKRNGPLGYTALKILKELLRLIDFKSGQLDPSLEGLQKRTRLSRGAVVNALARLKAYGFLDWARRCVETGRMGRRGPQVEQATNAYRLSWPAKVRCLLGRRHDTAPLPDDVVVAKKELLALVQSWEIDRLADTPIGRELARWGVLVEERESTRRSQSVAGSK
jgi:hypothetical protein